MKKLFSGIASFFKNEKDSIIKPTVVLLCICIIIPLALAVTNTVTEKRILKLEQKNARAAMEELVKADKFIEQTTSGITFNIAEKDGANIAYIFKTSAKGYGGSHSVTVMTAISPEGKILKLKILDVSTETPGLGQNAANPKFYSQFEGMSGKISIKEIDTITSATITSKAVMNAVNEALESFDKLSKTPQPLPDEEDEKETDKTEESKDDKTEDTEKPEDDKVATDETEKETEDKTDEK